MLLRSASSPILKSWVPDHATADVVLHPQIPKVPHHQISSSISLSSAPAASPSRKRMMTRALSEGDLLSIPSAAPNVKEEEEEEKDPDSSSSSLTRLLSNSGLDGIHGCCVVDQKGGNSSSARAATLVAGGGCAGGGGKICGGGGGGRGDDGFGFSDSDAYYQKMIESNPGNSLVLGNYARFLKEVRGDVVKAEEYCERAILASSGEGEGEGDGDVLSLYADIIWQTSKDAQRAERYFDQAVQAAPQDCYVMASYARFLWDAEEEEGEKKGGDESKFSPPPLFQGSTAPSVAAAS